MYNLIESSGRGSNLLCLLKLNELKLDESKDSQRKCGGYAKHDKEFGGFSFVLQYQAVRTIQRFASRGQN